MIPWFKSGNVRKLEDGRDSIFIKSAFGVANLGLSEYAVRLLAEGKLPGCGLCSDDLAVVCEAHASLSWYAFRLLEEGQGDAVRALTAVGSRRLGLP